MQNENYMKRSYSKGSVPYKLWHNTITLPLNKTKKVVSWNFLNCRQFTGRLDQR